jgi:hypothetical protein
LKREKKYKFQIQFSFLGFSKISSRKRRKLDNNQNPKPEMANDIDEQLYSRQLYVIGKEAMQKMSISDGKIVNMLKIEFLFLFSCLCFPKINHYFYSKCECLFSYFLDQNNSIFLLIY